MGFRNKTQGKGSGRDERWGKVQKGEFGVLTEGQKPDSVPRGKVYGPDLRKFLDIHRDCHHGKNGGEGGGKEPVF